ncbi:hypothetical protein Tco_1239089 [Tanacetum coccineum]
MKQIQDALVAPVGLAADFDEGKVVLGHEISGLVRPFVNLSVSSISQLQSLMEVEKQDFSSSILEPPERKHQVVNVFSTNAEDAIHVLAAQGTKPEGSMWWKETGRDVRPDGVVCRWRWTLTGVLVLINMLNGKINIGSF